MSGDKLASGVKSAQFVTGGGKLCQFQWDIIWMPELEFRNKYRRGYKLMPKWVYNSLRGAKCPV